MLVESPVSLRALGLARVAPGLVLFTSGLPPAASPGRACAAVSGVFAAIEFGDEEGSSATAFLIGERLLDDSVFLQDFRLLLDGRTLSNLRLADLASPDTLLPSVAAAVGGLESGQALLLVSPQKTRLTGPGTLSMAQASGSALVARVEA
jgi:hypothetical protein